jgi:hypothetical protein
VVLGAVVLNRLVRWLLRRLVGGLEHRFVQNRLESLRAKTPRALLASTDPLPSLRRSQRAEMIGAASCAKNTRLRSARASLRAGSDRSARSSSLSSEWPRPRDADGLTILQVRCLQDPASPE